MSTEAQAVHSRGPEAPYQEGEGQVITRVDPMIIFVAPAGEPMVTLQISLAAGWLQHRCNHPLGHRFRRMLRAST